MTSDLPIQIIDSSKDNSMVPTPDHNNPLHPATAAQDDVDAGDIEEDSMMEEIIVKSDDDELNRAIGNVVEIQEQLL